MALRHKTKIHPESETRKAREALSQFCRAVHIVDITMNTEGWNLYRVALSAFFSRIPFSMAVYRKKEVNELLRIMMARVPFNVAHFDTIGLSQYLGEVGSLPKVMTHHNAESFMIRRRIRSERSLLRKLYFLVEWKRLERYEREICHLFDVNVVMSDLDRSLLKAVAPDASFLVVENGVDVDYFKKVDLKRNGVLIFAGRLDQYSNRDGILMFMKNYWPRIRNSHRKLSIQIIGSNPPEELKRIVSQDERVEVLGYVDDVRPYFAEAMISICPLWDGGGTRLKILDALAQGMPIVSTSIGCEGIQVTPGMDILIADTEEEFVSQVGRIAGDESLMKALGDNARKTAEKIYAWRNISGKLIKCYEDLAERTG